MSLLNILTTKKYEKELRQKSMEVEIEKITTAEMQKFFKDLQWTMHQADGAGLAAPQVGKFIRAVCVNMPARHSLEAKPIAGGPARHSPEAKPIAGGGDSAQIFINPKILKKSWGKSIVEEGCLSIPGIYGNVKRSKKITIQYLDKEGKQKKQKYDKIPARILQHEIDHLDGILFVDKIIK
ncbi:MAG: peptide deformylase [Candidatus Kuenenbacteria bacterium]